MVTEPMGRWLLAARAAALLAALVAGGCATSMTTADFVNSRVKRDPNFMKTIQAADRAQEAFNMNADTPIKELKNPQRREKLKELVNRSRDAYRQASSYQQTLGSSTLPTHSDAENVDLSDYDKPEASRVPIPGTNVFFRVTATQEQVIIQSVESERGRPILVFSGTLTPTINPDFRPFLVGDQIEVIGDAIEELRRGDEAPAENGSTEAECSKDADCKGDRICDDDRRCTHPKERRKKSRASACTKDTDCKGDRICADGACVNPG